MIVAWQFRPHYARPRIIADRLLTSDNIPKWGPLVSDGLRLYFTENLNGKETVAAVPITGGQAVPLKLPFSPAGLYDISPDKTDLLIAETRDMFAEAPLWRVPIIGGTPRRLGDVKAHDATWSPDGSKLAYAVGGSLYLANADGSDPHLLAPPDPDSDMWAWRPAWSPDSRRIRFDRYEMQTHGAHLWEVNTDGSNLHTVFSFAQDQPMTSFGEWTRDGRYFLFCAWEDLESGIPAPAANLWAVREKAGLFHRASRLPDRLTIGPTRYFIHSLSLDGQTIFAVGLRKRGELMRYDAHTKNFSPYASGLSAEGVTFSRDGKWVAYVKYPQGELWRSRIDGSEPLQLSTHPLFAHTPAWSPDGKQIAFNGSLAGKLTYSYLVSADGGQPRRIDKIGEGCDPNWSADGSSLVFMDDDHENGGIRMLNLRTGSVVPVAGSKTLMAPRMSPDGRWIAAISFDVRRLLLFDTQTQSWRELAKADQILWPRWSHDGSSLYFLRADFNRGASGTEIARIPIKGGAPEVMLTLGDFRAVAGDSPWFGLTPQDELLLLHDIAGGTDIYALSWEAP